ncbi:phasin family protein [Oceanisphaera sp. W20_SRM_FM3]|uniref:phasin family protein n=1 Tax=Oceanisphaera sp. W20_SRM_FM3 TaxID=3240267 RepID=UPI003F96B658
MYSNIFQNFSENTEKTFAPVLKYNQLVADNFMALTNLQLDAARRYADIGLAQLQSASQFKDAASFANLGSKQLETMTRISQQMMEDASKLADLTQEFKAGLESIAANTAK